MTHSLPIRKRPQRAVLGVDEGLPQPPPALVQPLQQAVKPAAVFAAPLGRHLLGTSLEFRRSQVFDPRKKGLEGAEAAHALVDQAAGIKAADGAVGKVPLAVVKTEAMVDERGRVFLLVGATMEDHLAAVAVAGPLVKDEAAEKNRGHLLDAAQQAIGKEVDDQSLAGSAVKARAELETGRNLPAARLDAVEGMARRKFRGNINQGGGRYGQTVPLGQAACQHFVR